MFRFCRRVGPYERIPVLYSIAYEDPCGHVVFCYPIGLHWLVRWVRRFWLWTLYPNAQQVLLHQWYLAGFKEGRQMGFEQGKRAGIEEIAKAIREGRGAGIISLWSTSNEVPPEVGSHEDD